MKFRRIALAALVATAASSALLSAPALAQSANEQFFPLLSYRTGPYAPNGTPWANGKQDYLKMLNARDGGINGVAMGIVPALTQAAGRLQSGYMATYVLVMVLGIAAILTWFTIGGGAG